MLTCDMADSHNELCWTLLFQPPVQEPAISQLLTVSSLMQQQWPEHIYYDKTQLHITLLGLGKAIRWSGKQDKLKQAMGKLKRHFTYIEVGIKGLWVLGDSLIASVMDPRDNLRHLVATLEQELAVDAGLHKDRWWMTLARLQEPVSTDTLVFVSEYRNTVFGLVRLNRLSLVETNKVFDLSKTRTLHQIFAKPPGMDF